MLRPKSTFHGWKVVRSTAVLWGLQSMTWFQGYGNLAVQLRDDYGWSKTFFAIGFAATRAESALLGPPQGMALRRYGITAMMRVGSVLLLAGFITMSLMTTQVGFLVALGLIAVGSTLSGFLTLTTAVVGWFERKRSKALSYSSMGFAIGGFAGPLVVLAYRLIGWRATLAVTGALLAGLCWMFSSTLGTDRRELGQPLDGIDPVEAAAMPRAEGVQDISFTAAQALRTRAFWMISLGHGSALLVVSAVMAHLTLFLTEDYGWTAGQAALAAGTVPVFQLIGTALGGPLGDRYRKRVIASLAMVAHGVGLLLLTYATGLAMIAAFVVLHGLAWGARGPQMQALRADYFGTGSFGTIMGVSSLITTVGGVAGPIVAGAMADATGDYQLGFTLLAIATTAGMLFFVLANPPKPPAEISGSTRVGRGEIRP